MRRAILFRVPGQHGLYDFDEIQKPNIRRGILRNTSLDVFEVTKQNHSRGLGKMTLSAILSKFG